MDVKLLALRGGRGVGHGQRHAQRGIAPSRLLFGVPSRARSLASRVDWSSSGMAKYGRGNDVDDVVHGLEYAQPAVARRSLESRSSRASCRPVLAPEGTMARPRTPVADRVDLDGRPAPASPAPGGLSVCKA